MDERQEIRFQRNQAFKTSLAELRLKLALVNAVLICLALGLKGDQLDYLIAGGYLFLNLSCLLIGSLRRLAVKWFYLPLLCLDLAVVLWMIVRTGGAGSELVPFLFIPVLSAVVRCKYPGILIWCSVMAIALVAAAIISETINFVPLAIKIVYLYLFGIIGGYLVHQTYMVNEEFSSRLERWNDDLRRLNDYLKEVTESSDLEQIFAQTLKIIFRNNPTALVAIMIFAEDGTLTILEDQGWEESWLLIYKRNPLNLHSLTLAPIMVFKKPLLCPDIKKHPELIKTFTGIPVKALFAFPLVANEEVVGAIMITEDEVRRMDEPEAQILESIAKQAGLAIQNVDSLKQERRKANTDALTGLFNRGFFNEQLDRLSNQAQLEGRPLSLILLDVDNFKKYNDTYGHPAGDQLLKVLATVLSEAVREQDILARYGGEEFVVILKNAENELALQIGERIRHSVTTIPEGVLRCPITVSAGVGTLPDHAKDRIGLLEYTDKSLYHAKQTGKNRVCCGFKA